MSTIYSRQINIERKSELVTFVERGSRVLEFGTATGFMTRYLSQNLDCRVTGIELIPQMAQLAEPYAEKMVVGDIETINWESELDGQFDYILFADVLEHLRNPEKVVSRALKFLTPTGAILTSIPNIAHNAILMRLSRGQFDYHEYGLLDSTHIHFFTRKSMYELFDGLGLKCTSEASHFLRPSSTEFQEYYLYRPWRAISLLRRRDGHTYQFICKWQRESISELRHKGYRVSWYRMPYLLSLDLSDYLRDRYGATLRLPRFLKPKRTN